MADGDATVLQEPKASAELDDGMRQAARRKRIRWVLLTLGPLLLLVLAVYGYVAGGRYVSTDNAYVKADVTTISTDVGGTVAAVAVRNNEAVSAGQLLFRLDDEPYRIALAGAEARLGMVRNEIDALRATYHQKLAEPAGRAALNAEITRQATAIAYLKDFKLMMLVALLAMPMILLLKPARRNTGPAVALD
ncbi:biotin/lipoyl-binding protein [Rhodospirillaceae bacterium SYSU D60014]|uniref:biotin/lipoyl-binding protein n=1 Tax=Virgifigura deserti TaxID=2268457 RepID=UPI000E6612BF